jgi:hypothetical protein
MGLCVWVTSGDPPVGVRQPDRVNGWRGQPRIAMVPCDGVDTVRPFVDQEVNHDRRLHGTRDASVIRIENGTDLAAIAMKLYPDRTSSAPGNESYNQCVL